MRELRAQATEASAAQPGDDLTAAVSVRVFTVWQYLVAHAYYIGRVAFVYEVLLDPPEEEQCLVKKTLIAWMTGASQESPVNIVLDRLKFYALTRGACMVWFNSLDGQRTPWPDRADNQRYACDSRLFDSRIRAQHDSC